MRPFNPRRRSWWIAAYAAITTAACSGCMPQKSVKKDASPPMDFETIEYLDSELPVAPQKLNIDRQGHARFESHTNWSSLDVPEMGVYQTTLAETELQQLAATLTTPPFQSLPDHWGKVRPGDRTQRIRVTTNGTATEKLVGSSDPIDPGLKRVLDLLSRVAVAAKQQPLQVVRLDLQQANIGQDGATLSLTLSLTNIGTDPVAVRSPGHLVPEANGSLSITLWPNAPATQLKPEDQRIALVTSVRASAPPATASAAITLELAPGASAEYIAELALPSAAPGSTNVRLTYANYVERPEQREVLVGELLSRPTLINLPSRR